MERTPTSTVLTCTLHLFLFLLLPLHPTVNGQVDRTREAGGQGSTLVEAVLAELHDACIYPEDDLLLRRVAYVETRDGADPDTYNTPGYDGGIWKVDQAMFQRTQTESARLVPQYTLLRNKLGIDWSSVTWSDLRKPLYSAIAAALLLTLEGAPENVPAAVSKQAEYWLNHYRQGGQTVQDFLTPAANLEKTCARTENMDVLFLVDTSSSVGNSEWSALANFVSDIIISLDLHNGIGQDKDRVAMVTFSDQATLSFGLGASLDLLSVLAQVTNAPRLPGGSNFTAAFTTARNQVFPSARADAAKVIVLVSDGKDDDRRSMIMSMMPLRLSDVTFFTVGVGQQVDMDEMTQIASSPVCSHSYYTSSHQQLSDLRMAIERISCRVPVVLSPGEYSYPCGFNVLAQVQGGTVGTSITVSNTHGNVEVYGSYTTQSPSNDVNDLHRTATANTPAIISSQDVRPLTFSLVSETSQGLLCNGNYTVRVDSQAAKRTECNQWKPDLVFLLDSTLARSDADWTAMLNFVQSFSQQFDVSSGGAHVALVSFADTQTTHFRLGQHGSTAELLQALRTIPRPQGTTSDLPAALAYVDNQVLSSGSRVNASKTLIVVTSGTTSNPVNALREASNLHAMGARIVVAAVGNSFDDASLNAMASGAQHVEKVSDVTALTSAVGNVVKEACGVVTVLCVEQGINRECHIEDLINQQYGSLVGPDRDVSTNPCALQLASGSGGMLLERFPHPSDAEKFLLCDSSGQAYVVLCPLGETYNAAIHECRNPNGPVATTARVFTNAPQTTTPRVTQAVTTAPRRPVYTTRPPVFTTQPPPVVTQATAPSSTGNPCTGDAIIRGLMFHPYPADPAKYIHCGAMPGTATLETCPSGKIWSQSITQCIISSGLILNAQTNQVDTSLTNPCLAGPGYFPSATSRSDYIQCNAYHEGYLMHCPPGQVWNVAETSCDYH